MQVATVTLEAAQALVVDAFKRAGATEANARSTARALVAAEADGQKGHGLSRVASYAAQVRSGKVDGAARPQSRELSRGVVAIDAAHGFAYPAIDLAIDHLAPLAKEQGVAAAAISRSHHFGQAGAHVERLADRGLIALMFGNSPKGVAFWGSAKPMMGTNPIAFAAPAPGSPPVVIDLAISVAARGKVLAAQKNDEPIPADWALDADGVPTTDPNRALEGSMAPMGGAKGAALAFMIEILSAALVGGAFGFEASSLFTGEGPPPNLAHAIIAIDPAVMSGGAYDGRIAALLAAVDSTDGARRPGDSRLRQREVAAQKGLTVPQNLLDEITMLARSDA